MPAELVNITSGTPTAVQIWGFHNPCTANDVQAALMTIGKGLSGSGHKIHIMSGTHGCCGGKVGGVEASSKYKEPKFADEDRSAVSPKTSDGNAVELVVHDFNTGTVSTAPDPLTEGMSQLNTTIRSTNPSADKDTFLLAYCCSAGTK